MAGISIGIASETQAYRKGIETGVIKPTEDAVEALDDLGKSRGPEQLERSLEDAQDATEDLKKETKETADAIDREYKSAYREMKQSSDKATDGAKKGLDEVKDEAHSTAKESAASFDGSAESVVDAFQEVAANAFAGFGPAGAVAGLAAAAGIGLVSAAFTSADEMSEESKQRASEWADAYIEAGGRILSSSQLVAKATDILTDPEKYDQATKNAKAWGVSVETAVAAMSGSKTALDEVTDSVKKQNDELAKIPQTDLTGNVSTGWITAKGRADEANASLKTLTGEMDRGGKQSDIYSNFLVDLAKNTAGATTTVDEFGDSVTTLPDGKEIYIDAETGQATDNVDAIEKKVYGIQDKSVAITVDARGFDETERKLAQLARNRTVVVNVDSRGVTSGRIGNQVW